MGVKISGLPASAIPLVTADLFEVSVYNGSTYDSRRVSFNTLLTSITSTLPASWLLDGNTVTSEKKFGTIDNFDLPIITNNSEVARFTADKNFMINVLPGVRLADSTFYVKATASDTFLAVFEGVANAQNVALTNASFSIGLTVQSNVNSFVRVLDGTSGKSIWLVAENTFNRIESDATYTYFTNGSSGANKHTAYSSTGDWTFFSLGSPVAPTSKVHITSDGITSATFGLKVDNFAGDTLFSVRSDGAISMAFAPTGNTGVASGEIYFDTAANALSNGDLIAIRKT